MYLKIVRLGPLVPIYRLHPAFDRKALDEVSAFERRAEVKNASPVIPAYIRP
jgi:hypothetical protein